MHSAQIGVTWADADLRLPLLLLLQQLLLVLLELPVCPGSVLCLDVLHTHTVLSAEDVHLPLQAEGRWVHALSLPCGRAVLAGSGSQQLRQLL